MRKKSREADQYAEIIALKILQWLANDEDRLLRFMNITGIGFDDIRARAGEAEFLAGVMDFLLAYEPDLLAFTKECEIPPEEVQRARAQLPGFAF